MTISIERIVVFAILLFYVVFTRNCSVNRHPTAHLIFRCFSLFLRKTFKQQHQQQLQSTDKITIKKNTLSLSLSPSHVQIRMKRFQLAFCSCKNFIVRWKDLSHGAVLCSLGWKSGSDNCAMFPILSELIQKNIDQYGWMMLNLYICLPMLTK